MLWCPLGVGVRLRIRSFEEKFELYIKLKLGKILQNNETVSV